MVQRKVTNKLGIQADHAKSNKQLVNLEPSSPQHQDAKNRGADLMKKMKKSGSSIKRSDSESLRSSQPGKPPPLHVPPNRAAPPQKQSPRKPTEASPNYMKSTSSFDARKERSSPVSSRIAQDCLVNKTPSPKNSEQSKHSSASGHKSSRTLTRTSSLKLFRTLTKTTSFKPSRVLKKSSQVVLCEDSEVQRATCSSTLKDSKFPNHLELNPGGTVFEGTSAMKVCPYTYCSLNGHHHAPLPPLRCFLSARRRTLKTQKSIKLGCLSPRRTKPSGDGTIEIDAGLVIFAEEPAVQEEHTDFFIEIYSNDCEDGADQIGRSKEDADDKDMESAKADGEFMESLSNESPGPEKKFEFFNESSDAISIEMDSTEFFPDDRMEEAAEDMYPPPSSAQEQTICTPIILLDELDSEASDMEWEAEQCYASCLDDAPILKSLEIDDHIIQEEEIFKTGDSGDRCFEEILNEVELQGLYDEESVSSEAWYSELDGSYQNKDSDEPSAVSNNRSRDQLSPTTEETGGNTKPGDTLGTEGPKATSEDKDAVSEMNNEIPGMELQLGDHDIKCTSNENGTPQDNYACGLLGNQESDSSVDFTGHDQHETDKDNTTSQNSTQVYQSDVVTENRPSNKVFDRSLPPKIKDSEIDEDCLVQELSTADASDELETEQVDAAKSPVRIEPSDLSWEFSEADQDTINGDADESELGAIAEASKMNQSFAEKDWDEAEASNLSNSIHSEDHKHSGMVGLQVTETSEQAVDKMEVEYASKSDVEKTCSAAEITSIMETKNLLLRVSSTSNEELPKTCKDLRGTINSKRHVEELEDLREFNPREPNYLPVEPDPEAERVDLRHQMMNERKNAEEWMVDFALRQAVTRLAPARKRKVALLVEAFEKVMPIPKYETHLKHTSEAFAHARPMQACS